MHTTGRVLRAAAVFAAVGFGCAALPGCGPRKVDVRGKVTYQGKDVVKGSVTLVASDSLVYVGEIAADGTYAVKGVPAGLAKVGVTSPGPQGNRPSMAREGGEARANVGAVGGRSATPAAGASAPAAAAGWFPLPAQFTDPGTSGVTVSVGDGEANIDLR